MVFCLYTKTYAFHYYFARSVWIISFTCKRILTDKNGWKQLGSRDGKNDCYTVKTVLKS